MQEKAISTYSIQSLRVASSFRSFYFSSAKVGIKSSVISDFLRSDFAYKRSLADMPALYLMGEVAETLRLIFLPVGET
jgi:hypothetical protein